MDLHLLSLTILSILSLLSETGSVDIVAIACRRNPKLSFCGSEVKRAPSNAGNPFDDDDDDGRAFERFKSKFEPSSAENFGQLANSRREISKEYHSDEISEEVTRRPRIRVATVPPFRPNLLYTIFPNLQSKDSPHYCPQNQYNFQLTCLPGKKLRYDLQVFCQEYADMCGVPNINLYPSITGRGNSDGRPYGHGQKQKNGELGFGRSFALGLGVIPGFEVVGSQGADIGPLPLLDKTGGLMVNQGVDIGLLGQRTGPGPARSLSSLTHGYPSFGALPSTRLADEKMQNEALRALGVPPIPGLGKALGSLVPGFGSKGKKRKRPIGYEPGFGAVDKKSLIATGKTDRDSVSLPSFLGDIEWAKGIGLGIGKK